MGKTITIQHQETTRVSAEEANYSLDILEEEITTRELIKRSVQEHLRKLRAEGFFGTTLEQATIPKLHLTQADIDELAKAGKVALPDGRSAIDPQSNEFIRRAERSAIEAFHVGRLSILIKGRQITDLEEKLSFDEQTKVIFLRLVPLVGG